MLEGKEDIPMEIVEKNIFVVVDRKQNGKIPKETMDFFTLLEWRAF